MGRLTEAKKATSNVVDKMELARTRQSFVIDDIDSKQSTFNGEEKIQWVLTIHFEGENDVKYLYLGSSASRDPLMCHLQDDIAANGPIEKCYLRGKKNSFGNISWFLGEVGDNDYSLL